MKKANPKEVWNTVNKLLKNNKSDPSLDVSPAITESSPCLLGNLR